MIILGVRTVRSKRLETPVLTYLHIKHAFETYFKLKCMTKMCVK